MPAGQGWNGVAPAGRETVQAAPNDPNTPDIAAGFTPGALDMRRMWCAIRAGGMGWCNEAISRASADVITRTCSICAYRPQATPALPLHSHRGSSRTYGRLTQLKMTRGEWDRWRTYSNASRECRWKRTGVR